MLRAGDFASWLEVKGLAHPTFMPDHVAQTETRRQIRAWFRASLSAMRENQLAKQVARIMEGPHA